MKQKIVVSNIRIPESDWLQVKTAASDSGMSINEYFKYLAKESIKIKFLGIKESAKKRTKVSKKDFYSAMLDFANTPYKRKPMGASGDDKIIYGI